MKNLARLTNAANRLENEPQRVDRRKLPQCATEGCRRKVEALRDGGHINRCCLHRTEAEHEVWSTSWGGPPMDPEKLLELLSEGLSDDCI